MRSSIMIFETLAAIGAITIIIMVILFVIILSDLVGGIYEGEERNGRND